MLTKFNAWLVLAGLATIVSLCIIFSFRLTFNFEFDSLYPNNDPSLAFFNEFSAEFEPDDNFVLVGIENNGSVFQKSFLEKILQFTKKADSLPFVAKAHSLVTLSRPLFVAGIFTERPVMNLSASNLARDSVSIMNDNRLAGRFISSDARSLSVIITVEENMKLKKSIILCKSLQKLIENSGFEKVHIAGKPYYQDQLVNRSKKEFFTYMVAITVLITIILVIIFLHATRVLIALSSVLLGMITFIGFLVLTGKPIDPLSTMLPILMIIVGMSDIIHLVSKYIDEVNKGHSSIHSLKITIREIGWATFLTSATTAIGFSVLVTTNIVSIRNFGLTAAAGVFIAYVAIMLYAASLFIILPAKHFMRKNKQGHFWKKLLTWIFEKTLRSKKQIAMFGIVLIVVCLYGITKVSTNTHFENYFPRTDEARGDFHFFESKFGGVRNLEIGLLLKQGKTFDDRDIAGQVEKFDHYLASVGPLTSVLSPATVYKTLNQAYAGGSQQGYVMPTDSVTFSKVIKAIKNIPIQTLKTIINQEKTKARVTARITDVGSDSTKAIRHLIDTWTAQNLDSSLIEVKHTGSAFMLEKYGMYGRKGLFNGLGLAFIIISLLMAMLFRNWQMVIISMIPNIVPLLVGGALMGYFGIELSASTAIIFTIAFGIAVDDTIHFLSKFKLEINKGKNITEAIRITYLESGKAITLTSLTLFAGFLILMTSVYPPTFYIGFLVSLSLLVALLANLFLLPVCIYLLLGENGKPVVGSLKKKTPSTNGAISDKE